MGALARFRSSEPALVRCIATAFTLATAMFLLQGRVGINLQDEAFLWYGSIRTHAGDLPLRDFRAYDPGRYLWCAGFATILGDGLVAVRAANWAFAGLGLAAGLLVAGRASRAWVWLVGAGVVLVAWMHPPWKPYESAVAMLVAWSFVRLVECPTSGRRVAAGVAVGLAAFFGRNLGVYAGVALLVVTLVSAWKQRAPLVRGLLEIAAGTAAGYAPMLLLVAFADGFRAAFLDSIAFYARQGALNAELPFPFPWRIDFERRAGFAVASALATGTLFLVVPICCAVTLLAGLAARGASFARHAPTFALGALGLAWFHHASVRSDVPHLAQSIHPFLLVVLTSPAAVQGARRGVLLAAAWTALGVATVFGIGGALPFVRRALAPDELAYERVEVRGTELWLSPAESGLVRGLLSAVDAHVRPDETLWVGAQFLGLMPILGRRAPTWDIYPAWAASEAEQDRMLHELENVHWALLDLRPIGGDPRMRLEVSHPRVWAWFLGAFERYPLPRAAESIVLLRRRR
jgi:hypothetical protein